MGMAPMIGTPLVVRLPQMDTVLGAIPYTELVYLGILYRAVRKITAHNRENDYNSRKKVNHFLVKSPE